MLIVDASLGVSPTSGDQDGAAYIGYIARIYYHPVFVSDQFGDLGCYAPVATRGVVVSFSSISRVSSNGVARWSFQLDGEAR